MSGPFESLRGGPRLAAIGLVVFAVTTAIVLAVLRLVATHRSDEDAARTLLLAGKAAEAEAIDARIVAREPTVPHALAFVGAHRRAVIALAKTDPDRDPTMPAPTPPMTEAAVDRVVAALPPDVALIARFARGDADARDELEEAARRDPPMPWANHVLALAARSGDDELGAATYFWREGTAFPERRVDLDEAIESWIDAGAWDEARERANAPEAKGSVGPHMRYELAVHDRDWRAAARTLPGMWRPRFVGRTLWLAAIAALAWGFFLARLGKMRERLRVRLPLYVAAFALGVLSVVPTIVLIAVEEAKLHLVESGSIARDLLFFVFGVGLREEASKLLLFLPLLPLLRRWGDKLDVVVCGAMVGLGFAAEENLGYLASDDLHTGLARFLTANFLHAAMTGILASALDDFLRDREKHAQDFTRATLLVVGLHGAYDFLLSHHEIGGAYLAMGVFVILMRRFLDTVDAARRRVDRGATPLQAFVLALAVVTGASLAHAVDAVGVRHGLAVMAEGVLGEGVMVIVFAQVLSTTL